MQLEQVKHGFSCQALERKKVVVVLPSVEARFVQVDLRESVSGHRGLSAPDTLLSTVQLGMASFQLIALMENSATNPEQSCSQTRVKQVKQFILPSLPRSLASASLALSSQTFCHKSNSLTCPHIRTSLEDGSQRRSQFPRWGLMRLLQGPHCCLSQRQGFFSGIPGSLLILLGSPLKGLCSCEGVHPVIQAGYKSCRLC